MSYPVLELRDVTKRFGSRRAPIWALAGVSLTVRQGETLGLVGESGSGKSTIARIAAGLEQPTTGEAFIMREPVSQRRQPGVVQMVFQDPASSLDPMLRLLRSVKEPLDVTTAWQDREGRAQEVLSGVGLGADAGGRFPTALSGGQKQRASIARALATLPPIVICDEAVTALDVSIRAQVLNLLRRLQQENHTAFMFISHDLCTVAYMSDRIVVMYLGKIVEVGATKELFARPAHPYTLALLSAVPKLQQGAFKRAHIRLAGDPPSVMHPPPGCRFNTRCPIATERCRTEEPPLRELSEDHHAACHYAPADEAKIAAAQAGSAA
jgi:oligopeptide/dipeptide ABC transporter ATP-binding protein